MELSLQPRERIQYEEGRRALKNPHMLSKRPGSPFAHQCWYSLISGGECDSSDYDLERLVPHFGTFLYSNNSVAASLSSGFLLAAHFFKEEICKGCWMLDQHHPFKTGLCRCIHHARDLYLYFVLEFSGL